MIVSSSWEFNASCERVVVQFRKPYHGDNGGTESFFLKSRTLSLPKGGITINGTREASPSRVSLLPGWRE
jgi:hypothetical protein